MKFELITYNNPESNISQRFEKIKTDLQFMKVSKDLKTILVTSVFPEEGKSYIASNLAVTFSKEGNKVLIIDSDMRNPNLNKIFGLTSQGGFSNYLAGIKKKTNKRGLSKDIIDTPSIYIKSTKITNLDYMSSGDIPPNPSELLLSKRLEKLMKEVSQNYDLVIIDGTSCSITTDSIILSTIVDATILVVEYGKTGKKALKQLGYNLKEVEANVIGGILNKAPKSYKAETKYESVSIEKIKQIKQKEIVNENQENKIDKTETISSNNNANVDVNIKEEKIDLSENKIKEQPKQVKRRTRKTQKSTKKTNMKNKTTNKMSKRQQNKEAKERTNDLLESITGYASKKDDNNAI